jgi:hypothetical protein
MYYFNNNKKKQNTGVSPITPLCLSTIAPRSLQQISKLKLVLATPLSTGRQIPSPVSPSQEFVKISSSFQIFSNSITIES